MAMLRKTRVSRQSRMPDSIPFGQNLRRSSSTRGRTLSCRCDLLFRFVLAPDCASAGGQMFFKMVFFVFAVLREAHTGP